MTDPISDERLAEISAGLVGCTPGPWMLEIETSEHVDESEEDRQPEVYVCSSDTCCDCTVVATMGRAEAIGHDRKSRDASHIARLDPQTVAALLSRLDKAEGRDRTQATFEVYQDGAFVAMASGPRERAYAEAMHYAAVYGQDSPVEVFEMVPVALLLPPSES